MNHFSQQQLNKIFSLIREIEKLSDVEKLFLYLHLPCGKSDLIEGGKLRSNGRMRFATHNQQTSPPPSSSTSSTSSTTLKSSALLSGAPQSPQACNQFSKQVTLGDFQKQLEQMPKRPDQETTQTYTWILSHLEVDPNVSLPKQEVYEEYKNFCQMNQFEPLCVADFGKAMKYAFPCIKPRRLGQRGNSRYCYSGLRKRYKLDAPRLPNMDFDVKSMNQHQNLPINMDSSRVVNSNNNNNKQQVNTTLPVSTSIYERQVPSDLCRQAQLDCKPSNNILPSSQQNKLSRSGPYTTTSINQNLTNSYNNHATMNQYDNTNTFNSNNANHQPRNSLMTINGYHHHQPIIGGLDDNLFANNNTDSSDIINNIDNHKHLNNNNNNNSHNNNNSNLAMNCNGLAQDRSNIQHLTNHQAPSRGPPNTQTIDITSNDSSMFGTTITNRIIPPPQQAAAPQATMSSFEQANNSNQLNFSSTNYNVIDSLRPGTPDDDDYCHNYLYINTQSNNNHHESNNNSNNNNYQANNNCCNDNHNNNININYTNHYRHQMNLNHLAPQQQQTSSTTTQQHMSNRQQSLAEPRNDNSNAIHRDQSNQNNNHYANQDHQYPQQQHHHQHNHHSTQSTTPGGPNSNGSANYQVDNDNLNYSNTQQHVANIPLDNNNSYSDNIEPKSELPDESSISFKQKMIGPMIEEQQQHAQQQQHMIDPIQFNMFTLDSCVSSPFQSPASTPYPSHMLLNTGPPYEPASNQLDNYTRDQDPITPKNHYMTT